jgi:peptide/nickel transport system permease protein
MATPAGASIVTGANYKVPKRRHPILQFIILQPTGAIGLLIILIMVFAAIFADVVAPYDPVAVDFGAMLGAPSLDHFFGTDAFGRDVFSRIIYGARTALAVGFLSAITGCTIGAIIGIVAAYFGGKIDMVISSFIDIMLSFPIIVLALVVVAVLGKGQLFGIDFNLIGAIAIPVIPKVARVLRSSALAIREMPYIDAARAAGFSTTRIIFRHIVPNVTAPYLILFTAYVAQAILLEASLSFLGLGVTEPTPAWGLMLSGNAADFYREAPWMIIFPGVAISLAVFAFNLFGDALRDWLDPKIKV